jgi:hypothetical protein
VVSVLDEDFGPNPDDLIGTASASLVPGGASQPAGHMHCARGHAF